MANNSLPWRNLKEYYFLSEQNNRKGTNFRARCLICTKVKYISASATSSSNLRKHLRLIHPEVKIEMAAKYRKTKKDERNAYSSIVLEQLIDFECLDQQTFEFDKEQKTTIDDAPNNECSTQSNQYSIEELPSQVMLQKSQELPWKQLSNQIAAETMRNPKHLLDDLIQTNYDEGSIFKNQGNSNTMSPALDQIQQNGLHKEYQITNLFDTEVVSKYVTITDTKEVGMTENQRACFLAQCADYKKLNLSLWDTLQELPVTNSEQAKYPLHTMSQNPSVSDQAFDQETAASAGTFPSFLIDFEILLTEEGISCPQVPTVFESAFS